MKTKMIRTISTLCCIAIATAFTTVSVAGEKGTARGGATELMKLKPMKTGEDVVELKAGDQVVMACPKCKSIYVTRVEKENKPGQTREVARVEHLCPGCDNKVALKGHGKAAKEVITHVCRDCGSEDAFCCVLKAGSEPTRGMRSTKK